jgi:hypothetical protein
MLPVPPARASFIRLLVSSLVFPIAIQISSPLTSASIFCTFVHARTLHFCADTLSPNNLIIININSWLSLSPQSWGKVAAKRTDRGPLSHNPSFTVSTMRNTTNSGTKTGKSRSRMSAFKHGLRAMDELFLVHLKPREREVFEGFRASLHRDYKPKTTREKLLVDQIAVQHFRQFRLYNLEYLAATKSQGDPLCRESILPHLDRFSRYDWRLSREMRALHNRLRSLYAKRQDFSLNFYNPKE